MSSLTLGGLKVLDVGDPSIDPGGEVPAVQIAGSQTRTTAAFDKCDLEA
jgi:hypothetical protein